MNKIELIEYLKNININNYSIKGGVDRFNKHHPNILEIINLYSKDIMVYSLNKTLPAKLLYLTKYEGDINKLTYNNKIMTYNRGLRDFKEAYTQGVKNQWDVCKKEILNIQDFYSEIETRNLLKDTYKNYFGKSGNRTLIKENKKLYASLFHHTHQLDNLDKNLNKFTSRLHIFVNNIDIICDIHNKLKQWKFINGEFRIICGKCEPKYPSIDWFKITYEDDWKIYINARKEKLNIKPANSKEWFIDKYGDEIGRIKHADYSYKKMLTLSTLKASRYSKISQTLFWEVYNKLKNKNDVYFTELNSEYIIRIPLKYNHENIIMMPDFKQNNKIIEYNGNYWHSKEKDNLRYKILGEMGYDVLIITSDEFRRDKLDENIINKCINFLQC
jgi:very-short-patch-repair endonuclease